MWPFKKKQKPRQTATSPTRKTAPATHVSDAHDSTTPFMMGMMLGGSDAPVKPAPTPPDPTPSSYSCESSSYDSGGGYDGGGCDGGGGGD